MTKNNLKRIAAPKKWDIQRKKIRFITKPKAGAFPLEKGLAIGVILRDYLDYSKTMKESKYMINNQDILVNNVKIKDIHHIVGLMDIISIPLINKFFRLLLTKKGKLVLNEVNKEESQKLPLKVLGITILKKDKRQLNLSAGRTLITIKKDHKPGDTIIFDLKSKKIKDHFKLKEDNFVYLTDGKHVGESGLIEKIQNNTIKVKTKKGSLESVKHYAFVLGNQKNTITLHK